MRTWPSHRYSINRARKGSTASTAARLFSTSWSSLGRAPSELLQLRSLDREDHHRLAREWTKDFNVDDIPKESYDLSYARSGGPGGQHVNKTNSKAVLRFALQPAIGSWLPRYLMSHLFKSPHYLTSPPSILISSDRFRSASQNADSTVKLLHGTLLSSATAPIVGETSAEQKEKVKELVAADKAKKRVMKDKHKAKKAVRRGEF